MENFNEKPPMNKFQLKTFNVLFLEMGNLNFFLWKYLNLEFFRKSKQLPTVSFTLSASRFLVRYFIYCIRDSVGYFCAIQMTGSD